MPKVDVAPPLCTEPPQGAAAGYYHVRCMPTTDSPDPRCKLEAALVAIADALRDEPTVPGDPHSLDVP